MYKGYYHRVKEPVNINWLTFYFQFCIFIVETLETNDNVRHSVENTAMPQLRTFNVPIEGGYSKYNYIGK